MNTDQLTFTRFVAAITIVIFHFGDSVFPFSNKYILPLVHQAFLGVSYFFLLSGFVMMLAYGRRNTEIDFKTYVLNRAARILPLYYLGLLLMLLYYIIRTVILSTPGNYNLSFVDVVLNALLIQTWFPGKALTVNTVAWSLSVEALFYVLFPVIFNKFYAKVKIGVVLKYVIIFFIVSQIVFHLCLFLFPKQGLFFLCLPLFHLNEFFVGNALGLIFISQTKFKPSNLLLPVLFFLSVTILAVFFPINGIKYNNGLFIIYFVPLLFCIALDNGPIATIFRKKPMVYLGEISYGMYILQFPIYFFFTATLTFFHYKINQPLFYVYLGLLIFSSGLSFQFIEKPLRNYIKKWGTTLKKP